MKKTNLFRQFSIGIIWVWLAAFAIVPFTCIFMTSLMPGDITHPVSLQFTLAHYQDLFSPLYRDLLFKSLKMGLVTTLICLLIGYPYALMLVQINKPYRNFILLLTIIPFWTSSLLRTYAIINILKAHGIMNTLLIKLHIIKTPILLLFTKTAVLIGLVYNLLPFMILPLYNSIDRLESVLFEAAYDLGANRLTTLTRVTIPLTLGGIIGGCTMVFLPAITLFYVPDLLGGAKSMLLGNLIQHEFLVAQNWPLGAAISMILLIAILGCSAIMAAIAPWIRKSALKL